MDYANEKYVRIYTRDTTTIKLLGWDGRTVFWAMLRRMDRAGVIDLAGVEPWEAVVLHCDAPEDVARRGMAECLRRGCLVVDGDRLVAPSYIPANEAAQSDAQRARESRERRALLGNQATVTNRDSESQTGTPASQTGTPASQSVTPRHVVSRSVTPCCAVPSVPCLADPSVPSRAVPSGARETWATVLSKLRAIHGSDRYDPSSYREALEWIADKPPDELAAVLKHYAADEWAMKNPGRSHPNHIRKHWDKYLDGETKHVPRAGAKSGPGAATPYEDFKAEPLGRF